MTHGAEHIPKGAIGRIVAFILILAAIFVMMNLLPLNQWLKHLNESLARIGASGILIFVAVYAIATVLLVPGAILTIGAGFAFGLWKGFLAVSAGSTLGAALAFLVAGFLMRGTVEAVAQRNEIFRTLYDAIGRAGAKLIFLLRLSPVIPFNVSNYFYGLTAVKFWPYVLASWLGMMPGALLYVYIGLTAKTAVSAAVGSDSATRAWQYWIFMLTGLAATVVATIWITDIARSALAKTQRSK